MSQAILENYFRKLYQRTMGKAYECAYTKIAESLNHGGCCLDCGASTGQHFERLSSLIGFEQDRYRGIEWDIDSVDKAQKKGLSVIQGDLNKPLEFASNSFQTVFAFSVLEHLLNGCQWMQEAKRVLAPGGHIVILTPNISTFFTIGLLLAGRMPSSGPHPDSESLLRHETPFQISDIHNPDVESDTPVHRHLVVFSFRVLRSYLYQLGFEGVKGYGFGLYPFPNFTQPVLERLDPYHCHQMVFVAEKM